MTDKKPKFPKLSDMETIKKEYVFTVKENGKVREIRKPINLFRSHRSCIIDCDNSDEQALTLAFAQGKLAERERLNAIVVFDKAHKIDWYASYKLLKSQLKEELSK